MSIVNAKNNCVYYIWMHTTAAGIRLHFVICGMCQNCHLSERFEKESFAILGNVKTKKEGAI